MPRGPGAALGVFVVLLTLLVGVLDLPPAVMLGGIVVGVVAFLGGGFFLTRRATVVRLDDAGYRVRLVRGAGVKQARWTDVEDVVASVDWPLEFHADMLGEYT